MSTMNAVIFEASAAFAPERPRHGIEQGRLAVAVRPAEDGEAEPLEVVLFCDGSNGHFGFLSV